MQNITFQSTGDSKNARHHSFTIQSEQKLGMSFYEEERVISYKATIVKPTNTKGF
jgi:hypothetical protein